MDKIIINSHIKNDPLHENNLNEVLKLIKEMLNSLLPKTRLSYIVIKL